jgi:hypothetical protein
MINNENIKKNEMSVLARFLQSDEKIIKIASSKSNSQGKLILIISGILILLSILFYSSATKKLSTNEYLKIVKEYGGDEYGLNASGYAIKSQKKTKIIISLVCLIIGLAGVPVAVSISTNRNYYLTDKNRIAFKQGMLINNFINLSEIQSINPADDDKVIIRTNLGLEFKLDACINELINNNYETIYKSN